MAAVVRLVEPYSQPRPSWLPSRRYSSGPITSPGSLPIARTSLQSMSPTIGKQGSYDVWHFAAGFGFVVGLGVGFAVALGVDFAVGSGVDGTGDAPYSPRPRDSALTATLS